MMISWKVFRSALLAAALTFPPSVLISEEADLSLLHLEPPLEERLETLMIPSIEFRDTPLEDCLLTLSDLAKQIDPELKAIGFNITSTLEGIAETRIHLRLTNVPLGEAIRYTSSLGGAKYHTTEHAVIVNPFRSINRELLTYAYQVPEAHAEDFHPGRVRELLEAEGVVFPAGSSAVFNSKNSNLIVRNTSEQIKKVESYLKAEFGIEPTAYLEVIKDPDYGKVQTKLTSIIVPEVNFKDLPVSEALSALQQMARELDPETESSSRGVQVKNHAKTLIPEPTITLHLKQAPLSQAFHYTTSLAGLEYQISSGVIAILPIEQ